MRVIYQPRGRASEYGNWAVSTYKGCPHGCLVCYVPDIHRITPEEFLHVQLRPNFLENLEKDCCYAKKNGISIPEAFLSFSCDPFPAIEAEHHQTRQAIQILHRYGIAVRLLTKAGMFAVNDFDLLTEKDWFGCTLTFVDPEKSKKWEPNAAMPSSRIEALKVAKQAGISTWVSLEPVIDPRGTLELIKMTYPFVDHYKIGKLNHHEYSKTIDWKWVACEAVELFEDLGCSYYVKEDLRKYLRD